MALSFLNQ